MAQISTNNDSNQLLKFVNTASTSIQARMQEALNKQGKGKKVNHRKYIQKRLQSSKPRKANKLPTTHTNYQVGRQPIASFPSTVSVNDCERLFQYVPSPQPLANIRQSSQEQCDPEIDSILSEMGMLDSPSQSSLYSDTTTDEICRTGSTFSNTSSTGSLSQIASSIDYYAFSPNSDFSYSDVDDSAYSSPRNASPICGYSPTSALYYQQQQPQTWGNTALPYDPSLMLDLYEYS